MRDGGISPSLIYFDSILLLFLFLILAKILSTLTEVGGRYDLWNWAPCTAQSWTCRRDWPNWPVPYSLYKRGKF